MENSKSLLTWWTQGSAYPNFCEKGRVGVVFQGHDGRVQRIVGTHFGNGLSQLCLGCLCRLAEPWHVHRGLSAQHAGSFFFFSDTEEGKLLQTKIFRYLPEILSGTAPGIMQNICSFVDFGQSIKLTDCYARLSLSPARVLEGRGKQHFCSALYHLLDLRTFLSCSDNDCAMTIFH